jgi:hypothetical protein
LFIGWRTTNDRFGSDKSLFERYYHGACPIAFLTSDGWESEIAPVIGKGERVWLLLHRDETRTEIEVWLNDKHYAVEQFPFQYDEETLRWLKQGGPRGQYRSYLYKLYLVQGAGKGSTP